MRIKSFSVFQKFSPRSAAANAALIVAFCYVLSQLARLASNLILTRLLAPEIFGMMAILNIFIQGFVMFSDVGINLNIIQSKNAYKKRFLDTAWTLQVGQGVAICLVSALAAWPLAKAYGHSEFFLAFIVLGFGVLIQSFRPTKLILLEKNFQIMRSQLIQLGIQIVSLIILVFLAIQMASIWALVAGQVAGSVLALLAAHYFVSGESNRFCWDREHFREIFNFGRWVFVGSLFSFLNRQGDKLVLSFAIPVSMLGVFTLAIFIVESVEKLFSVVISKVALPLFSRYKNEKQQLSVELLYRARRPIELVSAFMAGLLFFNAQEIINFLYDERYVEAGWMLKILSISLLLNPPTNVAFNYFTACGRPKIASISLGFQASVLAIGLPIFLMFFELPASLLFVTGAKSFGYLVYLYVMVKERELRIMKELRMMTIIGSGLLFGLLVNFICITIFFR